MEVVLWPEDHGMQESFPKVEPPLSSFLSSTFQKFVLQQFTFTKELLVPVFINEKQSEEDLCIMDKGEKWK